MKTTLAILGAACLLIGCAGCGRNDIPPEEETGDPEPEQSTPLQEVSETVTGIRAIRKGEELKQEIRELEEQQRKNLEDALGDDMPQPASDHLHEGE